MMSMSVRENAAISAAEQSCPVSNALAGTTNGGNGVFAYGGSTAMLNSQFSDEEKAFQAEMNKRQARPVPPPAPLSAEEREQVTLWDSGLKDHVFQQTLRFILGQRPLSEWDAYVKELEGKNSAKYLDMVNKAHERYKKEHP